MPHRTERLEQLFASGPPRGRLSPGPRGRVGAATVRPETETAARKSGTGRRWRGVRVRTSKHPATPAVAPDRTPSHASRLPVRLAALATAAQLPVLLAALAILALLALPATAPASVIGRHGASGPSHRPCSAASKPTGRHSHHPARHACSSHHARKHAAHARRKATPKPGPAPVELVPATCEDGTLPTRAGDGTYSCEDGSAPSCEEGMPVQAPATGAPMCAVKPSEAGGCTGEASGECACEDLAGGGPAADCEHSSEPEAPEREEE